MIYRRELAVGAIGYVAGVAILRTLPAVVVPTRFDPQATLIALGSMIVFGALAYLAVLRRTPSERLAAAAAIALPVLLGDALETTAFSTVYPNFDPASGAVFASILLFTNLGILAAGWIAGRAPIRAPAA